MTDPGGPATRRVNGMTVVPGIDALDRSVGRLFVVVGVFDGLHRGHQYLLEALAGAAVAHGARSAVVTFDHHPDEILRGAAPPLLCDPDERLVRVARAGVAVTVVQHFDLALRMTPFDVFVRRIAERIQLAGFLMTPESSFGYQRGGTPETVAALGRELGYEVVVVPPKLLDGEPVSSGEIRAAIAAGDLAEAARLLGRPVSVTGQAVPVAGGEHGNAVTSELRFELPVALPPAGTYDVNVNVRADLTPANGRALAATLDITGETVRLQSDRPFAGRITATFREVA
jgi:riboflavin kinase / FMN adenylyltransferase